LDKIEDELRVATEDLDDLAELSDDEIGEEVELLAAAADDVRAMRTTLIARDPGTAGDRASALFGAALSAVLRQDPDSRREAEHLRSTVDPEPLDDRTHRLVSAADALLVDGT
jgi:hypothetical protein